MISHATNALAGWPMDAVSHTLLTPVPGAALEPNVAAAPLWQSSQQPTCLPDAALVQPQYLAPCPQPFQHSQHQVLGFHQQPPQSLHQDCQPLSCLPPSSQQQQCAPQSWCPPQPCQQQLFQQQTFQQQLVQSQPFHQPFHVAATQQPWLSHLQQPATPMVVRAGGALAAQPPPPAPLASLDERE